MEKLLRFISNVALFLVAFIVTLAFSGKVFADPSDEADSTFEYIKGQLVVSIEEDPDIKSIQSTDEAIRQSTQLQESGFQVIDSLLDSHQSDSEQVMSDDFKRDVVDQMGLVYLVEYSVDKYEDIDKAKVELEKSLENMDLKVRYVQGNYTMEALETEPANVSLDVHPNQRWHYDMINAPDAWTITTGSSQTRVAVLDTGIDSNHPSLRNLVNTSLGRSFVGGNTGDVHGHGTHVAGTIASYGTVSGVMQNATLIPVKVLDDRGSGSMFGIQQGIIHAASVNSDVINMSLGGGGYDRGMEEAIQTANSQGTIVVAATGNDGIGRISYPAAYSGSIAVGSITSSKTRSSFSNYGPELDVMAPGSNIYSTLPNSRYGSMSGTSMATPHAAGVLGLMRSANPNLSVTEARTILNNTAQPAGPALQYGHGIVDAYAAVQAAGGGGTDPTPPTKKTVTTVETDKSSYRRGDSIYVTATVTDEQSSPLSGARVNFLLTRPNGTTESTAITTNSQGVASWNLSSNAQTALGTYTIQASTTLSGYESSSDTTSIQFSNGEDNDPPETEWQPYTTYTSGQEVTYNGQTYVCQITHLSIPGWEPPYAPALWSKK